MTNDIMARLSALSDHEEENLLHAVMDRLLDQAPDLPADSEEAARELLAASSPSTAYPLPPTISSTRTQTSSPAAPQGDHPESQTDHKW